MRWWLLRSGVFPRSRNRTLCVHGSEPADFAAAEALLTDLRAAFPRLMLRLISPRRETVRWLEARYPDEVVLPTPWGVRYFVRRFRRNTHPGVLIVLRSLDGVPRPLLAGFERRKLAVTLVDGESTPALTTRCRSLARLCMRSQKDVKRLLDAGVSAERVVHSGALGGDARESSTASDPSGLIARRRTLDALESLLRADRDTRQANPWRWRGALVATPLGRRLLERSGERIDSFEELAERLGRPDTILCLGNGPSSEHPKLRELRFDALFRVNWLWIKREFLTRPDVVFTGEPYTLVRVDKACIFGFRTIREEVRAFRRRLLRPALPRLRFFTYERLDGFLDRRDWGARPTNGAVMLATAVDLRPRRLVIAGIDLFADPAGSYPGRADIANAYVPVHDREAELSIIRAALDRYTGEVEIIGDVLRERLGCN
jgi:hypothetical protein